MIANELLEIVERLNTAQAEFDTPDVETILKKLEDTIASVAKSSSGSWLGYHARVYYGGFSIPPPGAHFSQEWGLMGVMMGTTGDWREYKEDDVRYEIHKLAGKPSLQQAEEIAKQVRDIFDDCKAEINSLLSSVLDKRADSYISNLKDKAEEVVIFTSSNYIRSYRPRGQFSSRDSVSISQGFHTPPHITELADVLALRSPARACESLSKIAKQAASHLAKHERLTHKNREVGTSIFIGHGRSQMWRELKDFIQDRLMLPWDEFNRIPVAGVTNTARLVQMLSDASIAFLVMTAEDEQIDGRIRARENVVPEAGLFQGRLGFTKAIVMLEEGCEEFSNIQGLGQIRFPKGKINAAFEEVRQVLEREGLITS